MAYANTNIFQRLIDFVENNKAAKNGAIALVSVLLMGQFFAMGTKIGEFIFMLLH